MNKKQKIKKLNEKINQKRGAILTMENMKSNFVLDINNQINQTKMDISYLEKELKQILKSNE